MKKIIKGIKKEWNQFSEFRFPYSLFFTLNEMLFKECLNGSWIEHNQKIVWTFIFLTNFKHRKNVVKLYYNLTMVHVRVILMAHTQNFFYIEKVTEVYSSIKYWQRNFELNFFFNKQNFKCKYNKGQTSFFGWKHNDC